jgi:hypothetical protein
VALVGKSITLGSVQLPETAGKTVRVGMAAVGAVALALGAVLFIRPNGDQRPPQAAAPNGVVASSSSFTSPPEPSTGTSQSATSAPKTSSPASPKAAAAQNPFYLATLTPTIDGTMQGESAAPEAGSWRLGAKTYLHSLGYTANNNLCDPYLSATYNIEGSYRYLVATVGVSDTPSDSSGQGVTVSFEVDDSSGDQLGTQSAQYGQPEQIRVPVQDLKTLTLKTSSSEGCFGGASAEAVWGDAELLP